MQPSIFVALFVATLLAAPTAGAADLAYSGRYEDGVPDDWAGDDPAQPAYEVPDGVVPRYRRSRHDVEVIVQDTVVVPTIPVYGWPAYAAYPTAGCACAWTSGAYAAGYAYGYALGTFGYGGFAGYGAFGGY